MLVMNENVKIDACKLIMSAAELSKTDDNNTFACVVKTGEGRAKVNVSANEKDFITLTGHLIKSLVESLDNSGVPESEIVNILSHLCAQATCDIFNPDIKELKELFDILKSQQEED